MATGGVANVLYQGMAVSSFTSCLVLICWIVPYRFPGLFAIGCFFFLFNIALFLFNVTMISLRFYHYPSTFLHSILHPTESLFIPASVISIGTILMNISQYGLTEGMAGNWLLSTMVVMFWLYCGLAVLFSCGIYLVLSVSQSNPYRSAMLIIVPAGRPRRSLSLK